MVSIAKRESLTLEFLAKFEPGLRLVGQDYVHTPPYRLFGVKLTERRTPLTGLRPREISNEPPSCVPSRLQSRP